MAMPIKRTNSFPKIPGLDQDLNNLTKQLAHKDDVLFKNNTNKQIILYASATSGGPTTYKITISATNGQITNLEAV